jgi:DMSO/TMAO reductase YedYZ molybdopterin-dependent catalytic subunit
MPGVRATNAGGSERARSKFRIAHIASASKPSMAALIAVTVCEIRPTEAKTIVPSADRLSVRNTSPSNVFDGYYGSIDRATARHPQTILATHYDGQPVEDAYGFPIRLKTPLKLGFKQPKWITSIEVTNVYPGGCWEEGGYNWFSGV